MRNWFRRRPAVDTLLTFSLLLVPATLLYCHLCSYSLSLSDFAFKMSTLSKSQASPSRTPVYFLGIGGSNSMENTNHPSYAKLTEVGKEITQIVKPKAVVVFSAHWQGSPNSVLINAVENAELIYDFYGFPKHYYEYKFPNKGSPEIADKVIEKLSSGGFNVERTNRGLDHGVWAGFIVGKTILFI